MQTSDFTYDLPEELIAYYPQAERSDSRLLVLDQELQHSQVKNLGEFLQQGDLLVFNRSKVVPARLLGHKASGGACELLLERVLEGQRALCHIRASKSPKPGTQLFFEDAITVNVIGRHDDLFEVEFAGTDSVYDQLERHGRIPLPPYIKREVENSDLERYQTIYADQLGSVAAPTAGLHFDDALLNQLKEQGVEQDFVTLHVGSGTFAPVRVEDVTQHKMHEEIIDVPAALCEKIKAVKARGNRIVAVGTTTVRALESAASSGELQPFQGPTDIFIYPGFEFKCVDAMMTNFHLPGSTLMMLVSAFAGYDRLFNAYKEAVANKYRFYSYGDAMLINTRG